MRVVLLLGVLALAGCGEGDGKGVPAVQDSGPKTIAADISTPYDQATYPKTYAKWGEARVTGEIQSLREAAAAVVALRSECDAVMLAEVSDRTSPPDAPEVFVDCENGNRWRYRGDEPVEPRAPDQLAVYGQ